MLVISDNGGKKQWQISASDLRSTGIRSPQGFTMTMGYDGLYYWTTNEFAAYLFYTRYGMGDTQVEDQFEQRKQQERYLYDLSYALETDTDFLCSDRVEYRPYQKVGIEYCLMAGNTLIADEQRVGKTYVALGVINNLSDINKILITCPKTAKPGWIEECKQVLIRNYKIQSLEMDSIIDETAEIYIIHYDILYAKFRKLSKLNLDLIIGDEIHLCCKESTGRTKCLFELNAPHKFGLSGTALPNKTSDLLTVCKWLNDEWKDWQAKRDNFINRNGMTLSLEEANKVLRSSMMVRREQIEVFSNEPPERRIITIDPPEEYKELIYAERHRLQDYGGQRKKVLGLGKIRYALNHIDAYTNTGDKIVVFVYHQEVVRRLATSLGNKAVVIYGNSTTAEREEAKRRFKDDPTCTTFIGSYGAASMALSLKVARHILCVEHDYKADNVEQAIQRCSDYDQTGRVLVEHLVYENSLDEYILRNNITKLDRADRGLN